MVGWFARTPMGKLFQATGPATAKLLSAKFDVFALLGTITLLTAVRAERSGLFEVPSTEHSSARHGGAVLCCRKWFTVPMSPLFQGRSAKVAGFMPICGLDFNTCSICKRRVCKY